MGHKLNYLIFFCHLFLSLSETVTNFSIIIVKPNENFGVYIGYMAMYETMKQISYEKIYTNT